MRNLLLSILAFISIISLGLCQETPLDKPVETKPVEKKKTVLKYNPLTGEMEKVIPGEELEHTPNKEAQKQSPEIKKKKIPIPAPAEERYNPMTGGFEETSPNKALQYDPTSGSWSYESAQAEHRYNPYTGEMEKAGSSEQLQYNPQSGTWSYE